MVLVRMLHKYLFLISSFIKLTQAIIKNGLILIQNLYRRI